MPQQAHIQFRTDMNTLVNEPEVMLQRLSFKILEKRDQALQNLIGTKVQFKTNNGIEQGVCKGVSTTHCQIQVGDHILNVSMKKLRL